MARLLLFVIFFAGLTLIVGTYRAVRWWIARRFRVHLLTLWVLMILLGAFVGLNIHPIRSETMIGWPFMPIDPLEDGVWSDVYEETGTKTRQELFSRYYGWPILMHNIAFSEFEWDPVCEAELVLALPMNLMICWVALTMTAFFMEGRYERGG